MFFKLNKVFLIATIFGLTLAVVHSDSVVKPNTLRNCFSCEGINCQRISKTNVTTQCNDIFDICVTIFEEFAVVAKGCYSSMLEVYRDKCDIGSIECNKCFGELCNNKGRSDFKCIECDEATNVKCVTDTTDMTPVQCATPTATNSYCYVNYVNGKIKRGCYPHAQDQIACMNNHYCSMCLSSDGEACNSYKVLMDSAANSITISLLMFLFVMLSFIIF